MSVPPDTPPLRVLHLFSNYKWTGPADNAIRTAADQRRAGLDVRFARAEWTLPGAEHRMARELRLAHLPIVTGLELRKHLRFGSTLRDVRSLRRRLERDPVDVVHVHMTADHLIAAAAIHRVRTRRPLLVRSLYDPEPPRRGWRERISFGATDGVVAPTATCRDAVIARYGFAPDSVLVQDPPTPRRTGPDRRAELGLDDRHFVIGANARFQPHRRFELLWQVARRVVDARPQVRFVVLGRGNDEDTETLVRRPLRDLGLADAVILTGYLYEPVYSATLRSLDAFVFLVPGSDGTCRALREAIGCGTPCVVTERGMLPDLVGTHPELADLGPCGTAVPEDVDAMADALIALADDAELRARQRRAAIARVVGPMDARRATRRLSELYERLG